MGCNLSTSIEDPAPTRVARPTITTKNPNRNPLEKRLPSQEKVIIKFFESCDEGGGGGFSQHTPAATNPLTGQLEQESDLSLSEGSLDLGDDSSQFTFSESQSIRRASSVMSTQSFAYGDFRLSERRPQPAVNPWLDRSNFLKKAVEEPSEGSAVFIYSDFSTPIIERESTPLRRSSSPKLLRSTLVNTCNIKEKHRQQLEEEKALTARGNNRIHSFEVKTHVGHSMRVKCLAIAPGEKEFVSCSNVETLATLKSTVASVGGLAVASFSGHEDMIISAHFSPDGKHLATTSRDKSMMLWDVATSRPVLQFDHDMVVVCCAFSRDSRFVVTGCQDKVCRVWEAKKGREVTFYREHEGPIFSIGYSPDDSRIVSGSADRTARVWCSTTGMTKYILRGHHGIVISCAYTNCGQRIVTMCEQFVRVWSASNGTLLSSYDVHNFARDPSGQKRTWTALSVAPGKFHKFVAVACNNRFVYILDIDSGEEVASYFCKAVVYAIAAGNMSKLAFGDNYGNVYLANIS